MGELMQLRRFLYHSRNRLDPAAGPQADQVRAILATSVRNNNAVNVTGCLVYDGNWFAQVLEGDIEAVSAIFSKIKNDPRHSDIVVVENEPCPERKFPYWWMTSMTWDSAKAIAMQRFAASDAFDPRALRPDYLVGLMEAMLQGEMQRPIRAEIGAASRR